MTTPKQVIDRIESLWYTKKLDQNRGFREIAPKYLRTKKNFMAINVFIEGKEEPEVYVMSVDEYKEFKRLKIIMLGLEK